jgi:hypothetical protein
VTFDAKARAASGQAMLHLRGSLLSLDLPISADTPTPLSWTIELPPGEHWIDAECKGEPSAAVFGGRRIVFVLDDPKLSF